MYIPRIHIAWMHARMTEIRDLEMGQQLSHSLVEGRDG